MHHCLPLLLLAACVSQDGTGLDDTEESTRGDTGASDSDSSGSDSSDGDGDGHATPEDCDDGAPSVHPGAFEVCNGIDDDCDGLIDDADTDVLDAAVWYLDADADGFGADTNATTACVAPAGSTPGDGDCNDADAAVHPGAPEICGDDVDDDCDGSADACDTSVAHSSEGAVLGDSSASAVGFGGSLVGTGDVDGDGVGDFAVGSDLDARIGIFHGPLSDTRYLSTADALIQDVEPGSNLGWALDAGVDWDGDGRGDLVAGAPRHVIDGDENGAIYIFPSPFTATMDVSDAWGTIYGTVAEFELPNALAHGDVNGDGLPDLVAATWHTDDGGIRVFAGPLSAGTTTSDSASLVVTSRDAGAPVTVADLDGDGVDDIADVGMMGGAYGVWLLDGTLTGTVPAEGASTGQLTSETSRRNNLNSLDADDLDEDGYTDLLVGDMENDVGRDSAAGSAYIVRGPVGGGSLRDSAVILRGSGEFDYYGVSVAAVGDVNGDGHRDLAVGEWGDDSGPGYVHFFYGPVGDGSDASDVDVTITGSSDGEGLGTAIAAPGDVNGDGVDDVLLGGGGYDDGRGIVWVVSGGGL